jgi:Phage integrase family.
MLEEHGLRVGELVSTRVKNVDLQEGLIHHQASRTKTRQYRSSGGPFRGPTTARYVDPEPAERIEVALPRPRRPYHRSAG